MSDSKPNKKKRMTQVSETGKMTPQQEEFCRRYVIHLKVAQAAREAGYSHDTAGVQGSRLLGMPEVQEFITKLMDERSERTAITADYVLTTIKTTIERCLQAEPVTEWDNEAKEMVPTGEWKFEHSGVLKGCELLGRHLKLFTDKIEHSGTNDLAARMAAARARRAEKAKAGK